MIVLRALCLLSFCLIFEHVYSSDVAFDDSAILNLFHSAPVYDYVIIGAGTAGSKLANKLSEDRDVSVAVIEAGKNEDSNPIISNLKNYAQGVATAAFNFPYFTEPMPHALYEQEAASVGRMYGGSSSHNGAEYDRGLAYDWDLIAKYGGPHWNFDHIHPLLVAQENYSGTVNGMGHLGEIDIVDTEEISAFIANPVMSAVQQVYNVTRVAVLNDFNVKTGVATKSHQTMTKISDGMYQQLQNTSPVLRLCVALHKAHCD